MSSPLWLSASAVMVVLALLGQRECGRWDEDGAVEVEEAVVSLGSVSKRVTLAGMVWPHKRANVWPLSTGRVSKVLVSRGDAVQKGQPLAELDTWSATLEVKRRRLAVSRAQLRVGQSTRVPAGSKTMEATSGDMIDLEQSQLELLNAERALANTVLRAPTDGVVIHVGTWEGDVVASGGAVAPPFIIADTSRFIVEVEGDEFEVASLSAGNRATVFIESVRRAPMAGYVRDSPILKRLAQGVAQGSVFGFTVAIEDASQPLQFGMVATVEIEVERRDNVPIIPLAALIRENDEDVVYVRTEGRLVRTPVTIGLSDMFVVELTTGPEPSSTVVYAPRGSMVLNGSTPTS